jgi:hypothetical protein
MARRLTLAMLLALLGILAGSLANASANPFLAIQSPEAGSRTGEARPVIAGVTSDSSDPVTVTISSGGSPVESTQAVPEESGEWAVRLPMSLGDGQYVALAEQTEAGAEESAASTEIGFTVDTQPPSVTLEQPPSPSGDSTPSFKGTASEAGTVTVYVFKGSPAAKQVAATLHATVSEGTWSTSATPSLADGTYTALAEEESSLGNESGVSEGRGFTVDTAAPTVTLEPISTPTGVTTPSFSGFASDTTAVTVYIYKGGSRVAEAHAKGTGGAWSSGSTTEALVEGAYTAVAVQESSLGNPDGESERISFTVVTAAPRVTLNALHSPSNDTAPIFTGTASDTKPVSITIHAGGSTEGPVVAGAEATGTAGSWTSGHTSPALGSGEYTAVAEQESSLGNPNGISNAVTFVLDTSSPSVTLKAIETPSKNANPVFSGTASDTTPVTVHVLGSSGEEVASATGSPSGTAWKTGSLSKTLGTGSYTAFATESSSLGNPAGKSATISFSVNTESPHVTLEQPPKRSSDATPSFNGTTDETTAVKVSVFAGTKATGTPVATLEVAPSGGTWASSQTSALPDGTYTALAEEQSAVGNAAGKSLERIFEIKTAAPGVTLTPPPKRSNKTTMAFEGTAGDATTVTISVYRGSSASGTLVATTTAPGTGAGAPWKSGTISGLTEGTYTAIAKEESSLEGNPTGESNAATFMVETKSPSVTIAAVPTPSNDVTPTFSGTATDTTDVFIHVYRAGIEVADVKATSPGTTWTATAPALSGAKQRYTAVATQASFVGNPEAKSREVAFEINTEAPTVTIQPIGPPSNQREPAFSGEASDTRPVVVHVLHAGKEVASAEALPSEGRWKSGKVKPPLGTGDNEYTAYATEASSIPGNEAGESLQVAFIVDTEPPSVTLEPIATPSNNRAPMFTGTASDTDEVKLVITGGGKKFEPSARVVAGSYTIGPVALPAVKTLYKAVATQASSIGNARGESRPITFLVDPGAPSVSLTPPRDQIDSSTPAFSGTAGDTTPVTVAICRASSACGAEAGEWTAKSTAGLTWTAVETTPLEDGEYQAIASERSAAGDLGATAAADFTIDTHAPAVTLSSPAEGATVTGGSLLVRGTAGTAPHDLPTVTVQLFTGSGITAGEAPAQIISIQAASGNWSATFGGIAPGAYTVRALQSDEAGNVGTSAAPIFSELGAAGAAPHGPAAAFSFYPAKPHVGETVSLVSSSTDDASPITGYSWNLRGTSFADGTQTLTTSFATPGDHTVQLSVTDAGGRRSVSSQMIPVTYPLIRPFPVVRIAGTRARGSVRLKVLSVQAPPGATVTVTCSGKGCPAKSQVRVVPTPKSKTAAVPVLVFPRFERSLPPGVVLVVRVTRPGQMGKYTRFVVRRGKLPVRADACVNSTEAKSVPCTS